MSALRVESRFAACRASEGTGRERAFAGRGAGFGVVGRVIALEDIGRGSDRRKDDPEPPLGRPRWRRLTLGLAALLAAFALWNFGSATWIHARAVVAQKLIAASWEQARAADGAPRPWPWADTRPVARLTIASRGLRLFVLEGTSGRTLAHGPGHWSPSAPPGSGGNTVVFAHRDTHFRFLRDLRANEEIVVDDANGRSTRYRVRESAIVHRDQSDLLEAHLAGRLTLVTCYPFDAVAPGTELRYVVVADRVT